MPRSSRHKSHKQSKHSSKDYSDSDEDVVKLKDKSSKDDGPIRAYRDTASGEKRKISLDVPDCKGTKDLSGAGNGEILEEYASSKRRKERADVDVGGDRWSGGGDNRGNGDRNVGKENHKGDSMKVGTKMKDRGENLKTDLKSKSKRHESGSDERKEDSLTEQGESKSRGESKRRPERDSSSRKELKDKDRRSEKENNGARENKNRDAGVKFVDKNDGNKEAQIGDIGEAGKHTRENTEQTLHDELHSHELEKEAEKKVRRKREGSSERGKYYEDSKEGDERRLSSRVDRAKDLKYKDDKHKDGIYEEKYQKGSHKDERRRDDKYQEDSHKDERRRDDKLQEDNHKDERRRDDKYLEEADRDYKYSDDKYRDGDKNTRRRGDRHREDGDRDGRRRDEKHRDDGERDSRRTDDKYREGIEREGRRDDKYHEDGDRDRRRKDAQHYEDGDKDYKRGDERYRDSGERDDRRRDSSYRDDGNRDYRRKEEKYREDIEKDILHKDSKQGDGHEREKKIRDLKYRDEWTSRDQSGSKSDSKHVKDDDYADHHTRRSSAYDDSPVHDDQTARYRRNNEKEDYGDNKSRSTKDQRFDAEKISSSGARIDQTTDRGRSGSSKAADIELTSGHSRRWSSPSSSVHVPRDNHRALKQDESKYGDDNYEEKDQHAGPLGGSEKISHQQLEKLNKKDGHLRELSAERRPKSDIGRSPSQPREKSPSASIGKRQFSRFDARRGIDFEESTQRSGASREWKEYSGKEGRGSREVGMDGTPGEEPLQADADTLSVSSPFIRNNHFSSNSKSLAPSPPFRAGVGSPSLLGSAEDDARGKSNIRHRRTGDPNMGRVKGNAWGGVPGWPSPVANGFLPFPSHVTFPSVMQPFTAPPMFGVRRPMEFDHPAPYHMPDSDRFPGPVRPMGWGHQIDNSGHPLHSWDACNPVFGDDSHVYGRSNWDHTGNVPAGQIGDASADMWAGQNRAGSMEISYSEKEKDATQSGEALGNKSRQLVFDELNQGEQLGGAPELDQLTKSFGKNLVEAPSITMDGASDDAKLSRNEDVRLVHVYLSKLDLSADLTEPELLNECTGLIDMNTGVSCDEEDYNILYMEDEVAKISSHRLLSHRLFASTDDSIFLKSVSLYERQKEKFLAEFGGKLKLSREFIESSNQDDQDIGGDKTEVVCPEENLPEQPENALQVADTTDTVDEAISAKDDDSMELKAGFDVVETSPSAVGVEEPDAPSTFEVKDMLMETSPSAVSAEDPDTPLTFEVKDMVMESADACHNEEVKLLDSKCVVMVNSDMPTEAIMPESVMSSRIHHCPESTH